MKCTACQYPLWNLTARTCPECGKPFRPSEYDFTLNSVQFRCPSCHQSYYGTGARGHLAPDEFDCVQCGRHLTMDEMVLLPTEGVEEERTRVDYVPWCDPASTNTLWRRFIAGIKTVFMAMVRPDALGRYLPRGHSHFAALSLAVVTNLFYWTAGIGFVAVLFILNPIFNGAVGGKAMLGVLTGFLVMFGVIALGLTVVPIWLWALCTHAIIRLTGGPTEASVKDTANAIAYASTANGLTAIPCMGFYFGWIWWVVSAVFTVRGVHRVHGGRASAAVLVPFLLAIVLGVGSLMGLSMWTASRASAGMPAAWNTSKVDSLTTALLQHKYENGAWPANGLELFHTHNVWWGLFASQTNAMNVTADPTYAGATLQSLSVMGSDELDAWVAANATLPSGTVAHRVGDVVFTYAGVDPDAAGAGDLWLLVLWPEADVQGGWTPTALVVGKADGSTDTIPASQFATRLSEQNTLRATYGLAPLPDPATVRSPPAPAGDTDPGADDEPGVSDDGGASP